LDGNEGGNDVGGKKGVLGGGGMKGKDGGRGGSAGVAARSPRLVSSRDCSSRTHGAGRLGPCYDVSLTIEHIELPAKLLD